MYELLIFIVERASCTWGLIWPPLEPKTESNLSPISADWFIRRITKVLKSDIYLSFIVSIVTKMAAKIGLNWRIHHFGQNLRLLETD